MKANYVLKKHEDANEMHFHEVDRKWIIETMEQYSNKQLVKFCDHLNTYAGLEDCRFDFMLVDFKHSV